MSSSFRDSFFHTLKWCVLLTLVGGAIGSASAFFLWSLDEVTRLRFERPWLLYCLPLAGALSGGVYAWIGARAEAGNNLIIDQIHAPGGGVPKRMAPLVLAGTLITHLCGGSAGREGTAVQMGGSIASAFGPFFKLDEHGTRTLLMCGVAAGFGAVFGTPLAGAIFAMEVLTAGRLTYHAWLPCLAASLCGDWACSAWGAKHTQYQVALTEPALLNGWLLAKVTAVAVLSGFAARLFAELAHGVQTLMKQRVPRAWMRPVLGGAAVIVLTWLLGTRDYLGLGVWSLEPGAVTIQSSFQSGGAEALSWFWKLVFTCVTVGCGFKGGEVTPLFFIGAGLGNVLAVLFHGPTDLFAALGFVAVFAGASKTPLACTLMAIELFGGGYGLYFAVACFVATACSGATGIYRAQRVG